MRAIKLILIISAGLFCFTPAMANGGGIFKSLFSYHPYYHYTHQHHQHHHHRVKPRAVHQVRNQPIDSSAATTQDQGRLRDMRRRLNELEKSQPVLDP